MYIYTMISGDLSGRAQILDTMDSGDITRSGGSEGPEGSIPRMGQDGYRMRALRIPRALCNGTCYLYV